MRKKGNITLFVALSVVALSLMLANIFIKINYSMAIDNFYKQYVKESLIKESIEQSSLAYLSSNEISTEIETLIDGKLIKIMPLKVESALVPDYNDPEFSEGSLEVAVYGKMDLTDQKSFLINEYRNYLFYMDAGEMMLFAPGTNNLGKSKDGLFLLKKSDVSYYGTGVYSYIDFKGVKGYAIGLSEWNKYKTNGIYKIEIENNILLVHKINETANILIKIEN